MPMVTDNFNIGVGLSTKRDYLQAVKEAIQQARTSIYRNKIDLAILFTSLEYAHPNTLNVITSLLGTTPVIGCSSAAILSNKGIVSQGLAIMLICFPQSVYFNIASVAGMKAKTSLTAGEELGEKLLSNFKAPRRDLCLILSNGSMQEGPNLISGLQERLGISFPLIGSTAADDLRMPKTNIYCNQELLSDAACGIVLGGKLNFGLGIKHGWKPLGKPRYVTRSVNNIVYEIDGISATNLYEDYFACDLAKLKKEVKRISMFYPIGIYLVSEKEYLLRNILSIEDNGSLILHGNVPQGSLIRLMIGSKESCLAATQAAIDEAKRTLLPRSAQFVLVFDSISRYLLLGRGVHKELEILKANFGSDTPLMGICTFSEQAPLKSIDYRGRAYFHNQTITVLAIGG